jgi:TatD DNase family protein
MQLIDTHTHLFLPEFDADRDEAVQRALSSGVTHMLLPNVDLTTTDAMLQLADKYSCCLPMMGVHPSSVKHRSEAELAHVEQMLKTRSFIAIGEVGIDLYWDKTFLEEQKAVFRQQIKWALQYDLPLVIHVRQSFTETLAILDEFADQSLRGVFHCYSGDAEQAKLLINKGFMLGIGGVVTYKNSGLQNVVEQIPLEYLLLETDAPYLTPVPYRGKRNESIYLNLIASKIAELKQTTPEKVAAQTSLNAYKLFCLT